MNSNRHALIDQRLLWMHTAIAKKIAADPSLLEKVRANLDRELGRCAANAAPYLLRWRAILDQPKESVLKMLTGPGEEETALRQSSPFCGILSPQERWTMIRQFRTLQADGRKANLAPL